MNSAPVPIPPLALLALTTGVLLAHGLVVRHAADAMTVTALSPGPRVFLTRTVPAPPADVPAAAAKAPEPEPARRVAAVPRKPAAKPAEAPAPAAVPDGVPAQMAAPAAAAVDTGGPVPGPPAADALAQAPAAAASEPLAAATPVDSRPAAVQVAQPDPVVAASAPSAHTTVAAPAPPPAAEPRIYAIPPATRLTFDTTLTTRGVPSQFSGELAWLPDGTRYETRLRISKFGVDLRVQTSTGTLAATGLAPTRFGDRVRTETAAHFDRERGRVVFSTNTPESPLLPGAQDRLSVFVQLASMLAGEPQRYPPGSTVTLQTVGTRIAEPWTFTIEAPETLVLPGGEQRALRLTRLPRRDYDQKVEIWLAPALAYLPARIRITQSNGDVVDQQWRGTATP